MLLRNEAEQGQTGSVNSMDFKTRFIKKANQTVHVFDQVDWMR